MKTKFQCVRTHHQELPIAHPNFDTLIALSGVERAMLLRRDDRMRNGGKKTQAVLGALAGILCLSCEGVLGADGASGADGETGNGTTAGGAFTPEGARCEEVGEDVGSNVLRRLSRVEYQLTLQDLLQLDEPPSVALVPEDVSQEGFTTISAVQSMTAQHLRAYLDTATSLFEDLAADEARFDRVVGCDPESDAACLTNFTRRFGRLAYRRTLTDDEVNKLTAQATEHALDPLDQIRYLTEAVLISSQFLFRLELGDQTEGLSTLSDTELASKLSFTLWGRAPSAELLDRAEAGELSTPEGFGTVAREMLGDARTRAYYQDFFRQWLGYASLRAPIEPPEDWSDDLMGDMIEETDTLLREYVWSDGADLWGALTANHTTVSPALAAFYGISPDSNGRYEFADGDPRALAGLLGHASILSQKTDGDKISVRGNWVRHTFLCEELHVPPALAETIGEQLVGLTSIQIVEKRNTDAACAGCHSAIDPIGVGLAQFDATGRFDPAVDLSIYPIDPAFPDADDPSFESLSELAQKLRSMPAVPSCLTDRAFIYAHGRPAQGVDACAFESAAENFSADSNDFGSLLRSLVLSDGFRLRKAPSAL